MAAPHEDSLAFLFSQIGAVSAARFGDAVDELGLSPRGYAVLSVLDAGDAGDAADAPTQQELADRLGIHRNNMVAVIDDLERAGLASRKRDPADRRAFRITRTARGTQAVAAAASAIRRLDADFAAGLTPAHVDRLRRDLQAIAEGLGLERGIHPALRRDTRR